MQPPKELDLISKVMECYRLRARDPRIDPRVGDVLRFGGYAYNRSYYEVLEHDRRFASTDVSYFDTGRGVERQSSLNQWRDWAKGAEVLTVAIKITDKENSEASL